PVLLSGKTDVRHDVAPIVTATRTEPKPRRIPAVTSVMSALIPGGSETKCQPSSPGYRHSGAVNSKIPMRATRRHYGAPPTAPPPGVPVGARGGAVHGYLHAGRQPIRRLPPRGHSDGAGVSPPPRGGHSGAAGTADYRDREGIRRPGSRCHGKRGRP